MPLTSPRRSALADQVIAAAARPDHLRASGRSAPASPPSRSWSSSSGVARNTVREAVRALAHNGLLDIRQGSGTYVVATSELAGVMHRRFAGRGPAPRRRAAQRPGGGGARGWPRSGVPSSDLKQLDALLERREAAWASG